jgi:hypothetical protein
LLDPIDVLNCETLPKPAHRLKEYDILREYGSPNGDPWIDAGTNFSLKCGSEIPPRWGLAQMMSTCLLIVPPFA